jgi:hypothetical protein
MGQELITKNNGRARAICSVGAISSWNSSTSSTFCFKTNPINQAKRRQPIKHKNARFSSSFSEKPPGMELKRDENILCDKKIF